MARPIKAGVDYFPHDTDATSKKTIFTLESMFGNDGYAFWFKLLETLGTQEGLFFDCNKTPDWLFLIAKMRVKSDTAMEILNTLAQIEAIDPELWGQKIIWVQNFADRLNEVYKKRSVDTPSKPCFRTENPSNTDDTGVKMPQRKVKEIITKKKTEESLLPPAGGSVAPVINIQEKRFKEFWSAYPKKVGKKAAQSSWNKIKPDTELFDKIMAAIGRARETEQWQRENGRFIPNPATWLNQGRWDDEYEEVNTNGKHRSFAGPNRRPGTAAPGFKLAGEPDEKEKTERDPLAGFKRA